MGWYNIDILIKDYDSFVPGKLFVRLQGSYKIDINVSLVIPPVKAFVEGGKLNDGTQYGFDAADGSIRLPLNTQCYVIAFAEYKDKLLFGKMSFNSRQEQTVDIILSESSKELIQSEIRALRLDNVNMEIKDTKNAAAIKDIDKQMEALRLLEPKNCDCGFR